MSVEDETPEFELGDRIYIEGGRYDQARGRIYYMDGDLIRLLPEGAPDRLIDIPIVDGDLDEKLGINTLYLLSKRGNPAFVAQIDAHVGEFADTFTAEGGLGIRYTIKEVNEGDDSIVLEDETGGELRIDFAFRGVPLEESFAILRPRQSLETQTNANNMSAKSNTEVEEDVPEENVFEDVEVTEEEEEEVFGLVEKPLVERTYPDRVQRDEMFRNILENLPISEQKSPQRQKEIRQFVEQCMLLRNEVITYDVTGEPSGVLPTSFQTIRELLEKGDIPLARPVLDANRTLYLDKVEGEENPIEVPGMAVNVQYLEDNVNGSNEFLATQIAGASGLLVTQESLPNWYQGWEIFFKTYMQPWTSQGAPEETVTFRGTKEFFRAPTPDGEELSAAGLPYYHAAQRERAKRLAESKGYDEKQTQELIESMTSAAEPLKAFDGKERINVTTDYVGQVIMPIQRGLGPRTTLLNEKKPPRKIESGDSGVILSNVIFPLKAQRDLGHNRSGMLAKDIAFAQVRSKTALDIFRDLGGIPEEAMAGSILSVGPDGNTMGNISIEDWIHSQPLHIRGLGDAVVETLNMGLAQREFTTDQQEILVNKVKQLRAIVKGTIVNERTESVKKISQLRLENNTFLQGEALEELMIMLSSEPQLQDKVAEIQSLLPAYKENDVAIVAGICLNASELFLTTMAGIPGPLARERNRKARDTFLEILRQTLLKVLKRETGGQEPQPISCPHARSLQQIRKVRNNDDRMKLFAKFLARFQGPRQDNWVKCAASAKGNPHDLICYHEILLLQEYLHPREKDTLHKELLLAFSGGVFQGRYICKNCGQPIANLEFDQAIEFDDNGRPMSGREVLVDKDEIQSKEFEALLGAPGEEPRKGEYQALGLQDKIHEISRQLLDILGIYAEKEAAARIVERVESEILKQPSREEYAKMILAKTKAGKMEGKAIDYDVLISRIMVAAVGAHVLIEIQAHVPDYVVRIKIPGCVAGFTGYPLGKEEDKTGINYIACALASIKRNEQPWNLTGFLLQPNDKKRQEMIGAAVLKLTVDAAKTASVQHLLTLKRAHYEKMYGFIDITNALQEKVLPRFLPVQTYLTPEQSAKDVVVPAAATDSELCQSWIQGAHRIARENGRFVRGSPFSETSSCFTEISEADNFWVGKAASMPPLPAKLAPRGQSSSQVVLAFTPRKIRRLLSEPPEELFYRVFLRVCYDGPRKGLPHEPGYTRKCVHCGFVFPENPYTEAPSAPIAKDLYKEWQTELDSIITKGQSALETQKVTVTKETFQDVLDTSHRRFHVEPYAAKKPLSGIALLKSLSAIDPPPFEGWKVIMNDTVARVSSLTAKPSDMDIAQAYGPMSEFVMGSVDEIERRIGEIPIKAFKRLLEQSPAQVTESVRTYFLIPFQRLLNGFHIETLRVSTKVGLPPITRDAINKALKEHVTYLDQLKKYVKGYTMSKLEEARNALTIILPIVQNTIRSTVIPGGEKASRYIVAALICGILNDFINPNAVMQGGGGSAGYDATSRVPSNILEICLTRFQLEGLVFTEDEIRNLIERRVEAEKMTFINDLDKMSPEEKKSELMMKRLGLGKWSVGGTKAIRTLDPEQLERERAKRIEMGIGDFITDEATVAYARTLIQEDAYGGGGEGAEGGYENAQMGTDDY
jgi:hypothetical protein